MTAISEAVILMAGEGSRLRQGYGGQARLRGSDKTFLKPFVPVLGRPLISYTLDALVRAGIKTAHFVIGYESERVTAMIVDRLIESSDPDLLNVAVDRKLDSIFDLGDAMKVQTRGNKVTDIGKHLREFDAIDTGLFVCSLEIFDYLERVKSSSGMSDCSLADGVRIMAADNKVRAIDIGAAWWQDVDTPQMLHHAEKELAKRTEHALT